MTHKWYIRGWLSGILQDVLEYRRKVRTLKVRMLDGSIKTLMVDDSQPVSQLMVVICTKIGELRFQTNPSAQLNSWCYGFKCETVLCKIHITDNFASTPFINSSKGMQ